MVRYCCICKIESGASEDVSIHIIPKDENLKVKWFINIGKEVSKYSGVCSRHFEAKDFQYKVSGETVKRFLVPGAVPTLLLTQSNRNISSNDVKVKTSPSQTILSSIKTDDEISLDSYHELQTNEDNSNTILDDVANAKLQNDSYSCVDAIECEDVKMIIHVETDNNTEQLSDIDDGNTNSSVTEYEFYSEIVTDDCDEFNTPIDSKCKVKQEPGLKRKSDELMAGAKRFCNPRYVGDLRREDFTSEISWKIVHEYVRTSKSQCKVLNQKIKRLNEKVESLRSLLQHLKKNGMLSNEDCNALEVSCQI